MGDDGGITEDSEVYSLSDLEESTIYQDWECRKIIGCFQFARRGKGKY